MPDRVLTADQVAANCPHCGGDAGDNHFDRALCPCADTMHTRCNNCGAALDGCTLEAEITPERADGLLTRDQLQYALTRPGQSIKTQEIIRTALYHADRADGLEAVNTRVVEVSTDAAGAADEATAALAVARAETEKLREALRLAAPYAYEYLTKQETQGRLGNGCRS